VGWSATGGGGVGGERLGGELTRAMEMSKGRSDFGDEARPRRMDVRSRASGWCGDVLDDEWGKESGSWRTAFVTRGAVGVGGRGIGGIVRDGESLMYRGGGVRRRNVYGVTHDFLFCFWGGLRATAEAY
jgi:hypothetical protein